MGDAGMAQRVQVPDRQPRALGIVGADDRELRAFDPFAKKHDPPAEPGLDAGPERARVQPAIERDHPVDPTVEEILQKLPLAERAALGIGDENGIVAVGEPVGDAGQDAGIERLAEVGTRISTAPARCILRFRAAWLTR
jgi:hypothetical protein